MCIRDSLETLVVRCVGFSPTSRYSHRHSHFHTLQHSLRYTFNAVWNAPLPLIPKYKSIDSVSYTHLDVYKRQNLLMTRSLRLRVYLYILATLLRFAFATAPHCLLNLACKDKDVYKRQLHSYFYISYSLHWFQIPIPEY